MNGKMNVEVGPGDLLVRTVCGLETDFILLIAVLAFYAVICVSLGAN